jgi:hypothetical protein
MLQDATPNSNNRTAIGVFDRRHIYWVKAIPLGFRQQLRQFSDIHRDPPRLVFGEELGRRPSFAAGLKKNRPPR